MEPTTGIEPVDLFLTKEALYRLSYVGDIKQFLMTRCGCLGIESMERETRLELATASLEGWRSTN
jgi:hypothetical protein